MRRALFTPQFFSKDALVFKDAICIRCVLEGGKRWFGDRYSAATDKMSSLTSDTQRGASTCRDTDGVPHEDDDFVRDLRKSAGRGTGIPSRVFFFSYNVTNIWLSCSRY